MEKLFLELLNRSITAGWLILAVIFLRLVFRRTPKWVTGILWLLIAVRLVIPFSVESVYSLIPETDNDLLVNVYTAVSDREDGRLIAGQEYDVEHSIQLWPKDIFYSEPMQTVTDILPYVWLAGMTVLLVYAFVSYILLKHKVRTAVRLRENIRQSEHIPAPFVLGIFRPTVYLPFSAEDADAEYIIAHEKAHIRRGDHLIKPAAFLLLSVYWFHPLMWVAYILLCRDIELACDERVVKNLTKEEKRVYSETLLSCSTTRSTITACPLAFGEGSVKGRIKSIMNYKKPTFWLIIAAIVICATVGVTFLTNPPAVNTDAPSTPSGNEDTVADVSHTDAITFVNYSDNDTIISKALNADTVRQNKQHRPLYRITSTAALADFKNTFGNLLTLTSKWDGAPSFETITSEYDNAFFQNKTLFLVYVTAGSSSYDYVVSGVQKQGDVLCITITELVPESGNTMMAGWLIAVTVDRAAVDGCTRFEAVLGKPPATSTTQGPPTSTSASDAHTPSSDTTGMTTASTSGKTTQWSKGDTTKTTVNTTAPTTNADTPFRFTAGQGATDCDGCTVDIVSISLENGVVMTWKNSTNHEIGYGTQYHIYRIENGGKVSCCTETRMTWKSVWYKFVANGLGSRTFSFRYFDVEQAGDYVLEFKFRMDGSDKEYTASLPFSVTKT